MSYATSDKRIEALKSERRQLISVKQALERRIDELCEQVEHDRQTSRSRLERIDQLEDENAKLRGQYEAVIADYRSEVAKLRELFTDFWTWADPPFALKSGSMAEFIAIADCARELWLIA